MKNNILISNILIALTLVIPSGGITKTSAEIIPDISLRSLNGELVIVKKILKEKPVLLSFFFTDCKPCEKEIPELEELNSRYGNRVKFFLIATDREGADKVAPYTKKRNIKTDILLDKFSDAAKKLGVNEYPSVFLISRDGKIIFSARGYREKTITEIDYAIKNLK